MSFPKVYGLRCVAPLDDAGERLCGAPATAERVVAELVSPLCAAHAHELDTDRAQSAQQRLFDAIKRCLLREAAWEPMAQSVGFLPRPVREAYADEAARTLVEVVDEVLRAERDKEAT